MFLDDVVDPDGTGGQGVEVGAVKPVRAPNGEVVYQLTLASGQTIAYEPENATEKKAFENLDAEISGAADQGGTGAAGTREELAGAYAAMPLDQAVGEIDAMVPGEAGAMLAEMLAARRNEIMAAIDEGDPEKLPAIVETGDPATGDSADASTAI